MASTQETGHAKNVSNLQDLIAFVMAHGPTYNPSKNSLKVPELNNLLITAQNALNDVMIKNTQYNTFINARSQAFESLKSLSTRLLNAIQTTDASAETISDAKGFNRKMQGKRASVIEKPIDPEAPAPTTISTSQMSFDQQIQHLAGFITVLESEPSYTPNEIDLQIPTLLNKKNDLILKNNQVTMAYASLSNARMARNKILYDENTGLVPIAFDVKKYIKSIHGATSPEYAQISKIEFKSGKK